MPASSTIPCILLIRDFFFLKLKKERKIEKKEKEKGMYTNDTKENWKERRKKKKNGHMAASYVNHLPNISP